MHFALVAMMNFATQRPFKPPPYLMLFELELGWTLPILHWYRV